MKNSKIHEIKCSILKYTYKFYSSPCYFIFFFFSTPQRLKGVQIEKINIHTIFLKIRGNESKNKSKAGKLFIARSWVFAQPILLVVWNFILNKRGCLVVWADNGKSAHLIKLFYK